MYPEELKYTAEHEWIRIENGRGRIGITSFAQDQLGDVVYVELPKVGATVKQFAVFGVIDSVKASSDLYSPVTGTVVGVNENLTTSPQFVNEDPYGAGWLIDVELALPDEVPGLMDAAAYQAGLT
ncbi:MAG: glycine cleavage system protein GcvH [Chloroflexota bacterium]|nr:MAG: glycine cleavage system protein GcvH [Chloroflexota bacterium]